MQAALWLGVVASLGCGAIYPEIATPVREAPGNYLPETPAPLELVYLDVESARIPPRTRDGRSWDQSGGGAPDPFVRVFVNGDELLRTPVRSNTLQPDWRGQAAGNYRIPLNATGSVELWDSNPLTNRPICIRPIADFHAGSEADESLILKCDSGARIHLVLGRARPKLGLGFSFELGTANAINVSSTMAESPATRAGLRAGDSIQKIMGKDVRQMVEGEAQSMINVNARSGLELVVTSGGQAREVTLKEGPIYQVKPWASQIAL